MMPFVPSAGSQDTTLTTDALHTAESSMEVPIESATAASLQAFLCPAASLVNSKGKIADD